MVVVFAVVHDVCVCWIGMVVVFAVVHDVCVCWIGMVVVFAVVQRRLCLLDWHGGCVCSSS